MAEIVEVPSLVLADGTVLEGSRCGYAEHHLWCYVTGLTMMEAFAVFSNPEKTRTIKFLYGTVEEVYEGFTEMNVIKVSEFTVDIRLVRPNAETGGGEE